MRGIEPAKNGNLYDYYVDKKQYIYIYVFFF